MGEQRGAALPVSPPRQAGLLEFRSGGPADVGRWSSGEAKRACSTRKPSL